MHYSLFLLNIHKNWKYSFYFKKTRKTELIKISKRINGGTWNLHHKKEIIQVTNTSNTQCVVQLRPTLHIQNTAYQEQVIKESEAPKEPENQHTRTTDLVIFGSQGWNGTKLNSWKVQQVEWYGLGREKKKLQWHKNLTKNTTTTIPFVL